MPPTAARKRAHDEADVQPSDDVAEQLEGTLLRICESRGAKKTC
jgi:hypothetical protein